MGGIGRESERDFLNEGSAFSPDERASLDRQSGARAERPRQHVALRERHWVCWGNGLFALVVARVRKQVRGLLPLVDAAANDKRGLRRVQTHLLWNGELGHLRLERFDAGEHRAAGFEQRADQAGVIQSADLVAIWVS